MSVSVQCPTCQDTGWAQVETPRGLAAKRCDCFRQQEHDGRYRQIGVPTRFLSASLDNFSAGSFRKNRAEYNALTAAMKTAKSFGDEFPVCRRRGLLFHGGSTTKRTHLAVATLKLLADRGFTCLFCDYYQLLQTLRERSDQDPALVEQSKETNRQVFEADILLLDSLGEHRRTDWAVDTIAGIIKHRYNEDKGLIVTTNLPLGNEARKRSGGAPEMRAYAPVPDTLANRIGDDSVSRLRDHCAAVALPKPAAEPSN